MTGSFRAWLAASKDRALASDPGLGRLRMALSAVFAMGTSLAVEAGFARLTHAGAQGGLVAMLIGAVVSMMGSMALANPAAWRNVKVAAFFPVAIGLGLAAGTAVGKHTDLMLAVFVVVMFLAVFVRRFGIPFFFYGFMTWMGYFFASFLHTTVSMLPGIILAVAVASAWVLLLSVTVLRTNPRRVLRSTLKAYSARTRSVARACAERLEARDPSRERRWKRRLESRQAGLAEAALMVEGWAEEPGGLPAGWTGAAMRRRLLDVQQTLDRIVAAAEALAGKDPELVHAGWQVMDRLARRNDGSAAAAAERLAALSRNAQQADVPGWWSARHLSVAALEFTDLAARRDDPPDVEPTEDEYAATTPLMMGNLPGSPAVAREVPARGSRWNPLTRLDLTTRQSVQAAAAGGLAIVLGRAVDPTRYYWAMIAAFVVFTGTATRTETFVKAFNRVLGTLLGLFASVWLAHLTAGHTSWVLAVILASMFFGFYLIRVSYAYMIFFITIMLGQLYSVLHMFSEELLVLRLEETAVGAVAGVAVALLVTPQSTRDTVRTARDNLLSDLAELLRAVAARMGDGDRRDLDALARGLDNRARQIALVAKPLTRPLAWGNSSPRSRHRIALYLSTASYARALTVGVRREHESSPEHVAAACRALAMAADGLTEVAPGKPAPDLGAPLAQADEALFRTSSEGQATDPVHRPLVHLHGTLGELAATVRTLPDAPNATSGTSGTAGAVERPA